MYLKVIVKKKSKYIVLNFKQSFLFLSLDPLSSQIWTLFLHEPCKNLRDLDPRKNISTDTILTICYHIE